LLSGVRKKMEMSGLQTREKPRESIDR